MTGDTRRRGVLCLCGTPIGNLEDVTLRVLRVLREADLIAAEDTRRTRKLLARYDIHTPLVSYHQHSRAGRLSRILDCLAGGGTVAVVSESGMPTISDPGVPLVAGAIEAGAQVTVAPGPTAVVAALALSGMPAQSFCFLGFLPRTRGKRRRVLRLAAGLPWPLILYESPLRLSRLLGEILEEWGDRRVVVARELTKLHEEVYRASVSQCLEHFSACPPRGEVTLVVAGAREGKTPASERECVLE